MKIQSSVDFEEPQLDHDLFQAASRQCQSAASWNAMTMAAMSVAVSIDPYKPSLPEGVVVSAAEAVNWTNPSVDIRPRLEDKSSGKFRLIDSGSQISACKREPGDIQDDSVKLVAVNGSRIPTYGCRNLTFKINRKTYSIPAVVCDISQDILGIDFIDKYKLGFEWDEFDQTVLYIVDKKAAIKAPLQMVTVPTNLQRVSYLESSGSGGPAHSAPESGLKPLVKDNNSILFEVSCVEKLEKVEKKKVSQESLLNKIEGDYVKLIKKYPKLLKPTFTKGEPAHSVYHRIETGDHPPCRSKRRPLINDPVKAEKGRRVWEQMIEDGIIERVEAGSNTDWTSSLHLAPKEGGGVRPCSDFRELNRKTITDSYPLPLLRDFQKKIHGAKIFSRVDLKSAFFNVPIWPSHRYKTTTLSPWGGAYVYNRMPFGLSSGPATWQKLMDTILKDVPDTFCYLDDIIVWSDNKEAHLARLDQVFKILSDNDMALSLDKCIFGTDEVEYLGYKVSTRGLLPLPRKLQALKEFKTPIKQKDVLHFCGALNYFRSSLRGIRQPDGTWKSAATVLQPLYAIGTEKLPPKSDFKVIWEHSKVLRDAFEEAKLMLTQAVELVHPNPNWPLALFTDASDHSVGGALQMLCPDGTYQPLGFYSCHLNPAQAKYSVFKKELLGVHKSLRHFLPEVYGKHCTIYTDHLPLQNAFESNNIPLQDPQVYRQLTEIGRFTREIKHVSGAHNVFADFLSRIVPENKKGTAYQEAEDETPPIEVAGTEDISLQVTTVKALQELQENCPEIKLIKSGDQPKSASFKNVNIDGTDLFCEVSGKKARPYVPKPLRDTITTSLHSIDHLGFKPSLKRIAGEYYWPSIKGDIKTYVKTCVPCKKVKQGERLVNMGSFSVPDKRFSHVMIDMVGPLPESYGYKYILTSICRTTRMIQATPMKEATASAAASAFLHNWVALFGVPARVTSDNGANFLAALWKDMMSRLNIKINYSALYRPQSIGMLERQHRNIKESLKASIAELGDKYQNKWLDYLPFVLLGRRVAHQQDLGASPSEMCFGTNVVIPGQILSDPGELDSEETLSKLLQDVRTNTLRPTSQPSRHNKPEKELPGIPEGVTHAYTKQHQTTGLQASYEGPFAIAERLSRSTVKLEVGLFKDGRKRYEIRHANDLKFAHPESLAAPVHRPKLGRPADPSRTSVPSEGQTTTEESRLASDASNRFPDPPNFQPAVQSKQAVNPTASGASRNETNHETSISEQPDRTPSLRPVRSTRNPAPNYVDAVAVANRPWSATQVEIKALNDSIRQSRSLI